MPPEATSVGEDMPLFEDYLNSAFPCDDLFFDDKGEGSMLEASLLRTYSEDRGASSSPESLPSSSSKDDSTNEMDSDISMAIHDSIIAEHDHSLASANLSSLGNCKLARSATTDTLGAASLAQQPGMTYQLNLHGIPSKSRVETQIRLGLQIVRVAMHGEAGREENGIGDRFQWLKLPSWAMAKEKLKIQNRRDAPATIDPNRIVFLDARVVKSSEPLEDVTICPGCVTRERKRAQRKKDPPKRSVEPSTGDGTVKTDSSELVPLPDENRKILVFNCPELLEITNGEVIIPTRVTCYCRHHKEKDGFRIIITLRDALNNILASTSSELVLITDDHKTTGKVQRVKDQLTSSVKGQPFVVPATKSDSCPATGLIASTLLPAAPLGKAKSLSRRSSISSTATSYKKRKAENPSQSTPQANNSAKMQKLPGSLSMTNINAHKESSTTLPASTASSRLVSPTLSSRQYKRSPSHDSLVDFMNTAGPFSSRNAPSNSPNHTTSIANSVNSPNPSFFDTSMDELMQEHTVSMSPRARTWDYIMDTASSSHAQPGNRQPSIIMPPTPLSQSMQDVPVVSRMVPSEGPLQGGIEVTILGNGFRPGMTVLFGETAAIPTHCWSSTTLVCVLPPATNAGPVAVTFKEHPLCVGAKMFTYVDETDRALYELALQVIGLKTTGKLETARNVAMRICASKLPSETMDANFTSMPMHQLRTALGMTDGTLHTEELVRRCLRYLDEIDNSRTVRISLRTMSGHTLLHFAIMKGYKYLVEDLLDRGSNVNIRDRTSFTPLHIAALYGDPVICRLILQTSTPNLSLCTSEGKTAYDIAASQDDPELLELLDPWTFALETRNAFAPRGYRSRSNSGLSDPVEYDETSSTISSTYAPSLDSDFSYSLESVDSSRPISSRLHGTRTQPTSRAQSPERAPGTRRSQRMEARHRSMSVNNLMLTGLSRKQMQELVDESKSTKTLHNTPADPMDVQNVMNNMIQLQNTWMAFLSETSPAWLQKTLANANASLPELLKTPPNMQFSSSPISAFQAMLPGLPQIRPLTKLVDQEDSARPNSSSNDTGWLQNLVTSLGAPPSYAEAISSVTTSATSVAESAACGPSRPRSEARQDLSTESGDTRLEPSPKWFGGRSLTMPFRSQGRVAEMTPEQQRAQVARFQKPADRMMFFFWLPCLMFFIAISIGKAFFDKVFDLLP